MASNVFLQDLRNDSLSQDKHHLNCFLAFLIQNRSIVSPALKTSRMLFQSTNLIVKLPGSYQISEKVVGFQNLTPVQVTPIITPRSSTKFSFFRSYS